MIGCVLKTKGMVNDVQLLMMLAKRAGERAILKHRLACISVTGLHNESSLIISHKIQYIAVSQKAKHRVSMQMPARVNEKHNQKVLADIIDKADREDLIESGMVAYSRSRGYLLAHTITATNT